MREGAIRGSAEFLRKGPPLSGSNSPPVEPLDKAGVPADRKQDVRDGDLDVKLLAKTRPRGFQKRRESWALAGCQVEMDELPHLGTFVEIEGPDEASITAVRDRLALASVPGIIETYIAMLADYCRSHGLSLDDIRFA